MKEYYNMLGSLMGSLHLLRTTTSHLGTAILGAISQNEGYRYLLEVPDSKGYNILSVYWGPPPYRGSDIVVNSPIPYMLPQTLKSLKRAGHGCQGEQKKAQCRNL